MTKQGNIISKNGHSRYLFGSYLEQICPYLDTNVQKKGNKRNVVRKCKQEN